GVPDDKDEQGLAAADPAGPVPAALRRLREAGLPLVLIADVCLCEYTTHGHCGVLKGEQVDNDASLPALAEAAVSYAEAGVDVVAPSAMMDGQVRALRAALDAAGHDRTAILAYASKHASAFYGPFREAAGSTPTFGDRRSYQMDFANGREAMREMELDAVGGPDSPGCDPRTPAAALAPGAAPPLDPPSPRLPGARRGGDAGGGRRAR